LRKDIIIDQMIGDSAEKEWDLIGLGEGEWGGYTYTLSMSRHKKNLLIKKVVDWRLKISYNNAC